MTQPRHSLCGFFGRNIQNTITVGVPDKGMLTWGPILGPEKVAQVAAYVVHKNREATGATGGETGEKADSAGQS